jgi:hypothetical protein
MPMGARQKSMGMSDILTPDEMNLIGNPFELESDCIVRIVFFRG